MKNYVINPCSGSYNEVGDEFTFHLNEHYFLTDPDELQFSHYPFLNVGKLTVNKL